MRNRCAAALDFDRNVAPRRAAHHGDELGAVGDGLAVDRQQPVARPQSRARAGAARGADCTSVSAFQVARSKPSPGSSLPGSVIARRSAADPQRQRALAAVAAHPQRNHAVVGELPDQRRSAAPRCPRPCGRRRARSRSPRCKPGGGGGAVEPHLPDDRLDDFGADHRQNRVQQRGEQQIHGGSRQQHRDPMR